MSLLHSKLTLFAVICFFKISYSLDHCERIIVSTLSGRIEGSISEQTLLGKRNFYSFKGIPYAQPPISSLRFKAPQKVEPWSGTLLALEYGHACPQISMDNLNNGKYDGNENCLTLNVFTPNLTPTQKLSVIFYIHCGGFTAGHARLNTPEILLDEDVVLVTIQYRLGPFGFLTFGTPEHSGNMGLKDQLLALHWVRDNIHSFGGNKDSITVFGHSAGAASVNFHLLSPQSRGLFKRAIIVGASAYNGYAYRPKVTDQTNIVQSHLSSLLGKPADNLTDYDIETWILNGDTKSFIEATYVDMYTPGLKSKRFDMLWTPIVEKKDAIQPFLTEEPAELYEQPSNVDTLFGYSSSEAIGLLGSEFINASLLAPFNEHFKLLEPPLAELELNTSTSDYAAYLSEIRQFYFGTKKVDSSTLNELTRLISDLFSAFPIDKAAKDQAKRSTGSTYYFQFDVQNSTLNYYRRLSQADKFRVSGSAHIEDLPFVFKSALLPGKLYDELQANDIQLIRNIRRFYVHFVNFGNPGLSNFTNGLNQIIARENNFVNIIDTGFTLGTDNRGEAFRFWTELIEKYRHIFITRK